MATLARRRFLARRTWEHRGALTWGQFEMIDADIILLQARWW